MKAILLFVCGVFTLQSTNAQYIRTTPAVATAPIIKTDDVATTLADTLSLLTVSSLLAEKLPFDYLCAPVIPPYTPPCSHIPSLAPPCAPYFPAAPPVEIIAPVVNNCGCGSYGYPYSAYVL